MLINNVGTNRRKAALDATAEDLASLMSTNVQSALRMSQLCHPWLAKAGSSSIIFTSSVAGGPLAMKSGCMYAMTKGVQLPNRASCLACTAAPTAAGQLQDGHTRGNHALGTDVALSPEFVTEPASSDSNGWLWRHVDLAPPQLTVQRRALNTYRS